LSRREGYERALGRLAPIKDASSLCLFSLSLLIQTSASIKDAFFLNLVDHITKAINRRESYLLHFHPLHQLLARPPLRRLAWDKPTIAVNNPDHVILVLPVELWWTPRTGQFGGLDLL
jgi:hypothetical protein